MTNTDGLWVFEETGAIITTEEMIHSHPNVSFPIPFSPLNGYVALEEVRPEYNPKTQRLVISELALFADGKWSRTFLVEDLTAEEIAAILKALQNTKWEQIKTERDQRKSSGVKVGTNWFHSDPDSRIQQLGLVMAGASLPAGIQWKTLNVDVNGQPNFVEMTPTLAMQIYQTTMLSDAAIFAAAETHRITMEASTDPENYDITANWPESYQP